MQGLLVVIAPVLLILFALAMQRIEGHLQRLTVQDNDVQEFIDTHAPAELPAAELVGVGTPSASAGAPAGS